MNALTALYELLIAQTAIAALVGTRVYGPNQVIKKANFPCILISRVGGSSDLEDEVRAIENAIFDVRCYGNSQPEANAVYAALRDLDKLVNLKTTNYHFHVIELVQTGSDLPEQITESERWDAVYCTLRAEIEKK